MFYGLVDIGVEYVNNVGVVKSGLVCMLNFIGIVLLWWGVCGKEDLGGGLYVVFMFELGFVLDFGILN